MLLMYALHLIAVVSPFAGHFDPRLDDSIVTCCGNKVMGMGTYVSNFIIPFNLIVVINISASIVTSFHRFLVGFSCSKLASHKKSSHTIHPF